VKSFARSPLTRRARARADLSPTGRGGASGTASRTPQLLRAILCAIALVAFLAGLASHASAQDTFKLAIGQMETWTNQAANLAPRVGIFQKHGIVVETFGTQGGGETLQAVISGAADIGIGIGTLGAMRAFANGAPVRIFAPRFTGAGDFYWYVRADSPISELKDATERHTIAYSTSGASSHNVVLAFAAELGVKAKPTATGGQPATLTQVMSGQIDIGWAAPPFGLKEVAEGKIRIVANGNDAPSMRTQTVRVEIVNANVLKQRGEAFARFVRAYREAVDWMFSDRSAVLWYAQQFGWVPDLAKETKERYQTREAKQMDRIADVDAIMADGVKLKFLDKPLTKEQLAELIQITPQ
jgi:NitT/TauT family transport system substrate-binding protein